MNLKKIKFLSFFIIFSMSFLSHFMYDWIPNTFISFFFPVNESIWEHMKILYTSIIISGIIEFILLKFFKIDFNNFMFQLFLEAYLSIIIYLIIYLPVYFLIGENLIFSISLMALVYIIVIVISYYIMCASKFLYLNEISFIFLILGYLIFIYFTYNPSHNYIFYDTTDEHYGLGYN